MHMTSSKSVVLIIVIALVVLAGGAWYLQRGVAPSQEEHLGGGREEAEDTTVEDIQMPVEGAPESAVIRYTDSGYEPSSLAVKRGAAVIFKNESSREMWPASAMHPTHKVYPTTGGCIGSTFDACRGSKQGEEWIFMFDAVGAWGYHDHLNPRSFGSITVE